METDKILVLNIGPAEHLCSNLRQILERSTDLKVKVEQRSRLETPNGGFFCGQMSNAIAHFRPRVIFLVLASQQFEQVIVRIEEAQMTLIARAGMRRAATLEAKDFKASASQLIAQMNAKFSGGEIGQPTRLVNRFVAWAAGDNDFHGLRALLAMDKHRSR